MIDLKQHRLAAHLTQTQVAARMGISLASLRDHEQGRGGSPTLAWLTRWAAALGKDLTITLADPQLLHLPSDSQLLHSPSDPQLLR
jgi:transcriptional regulator with XRE-family HTH domain